MMGYKGEIKRHIFPKKKRKNKTLQRVKFGGLKIFLYLCIDIETVRNTYEIHHCQYH